MTDPRDKIEVPEDFPGTGDGGGPSDIEKDPEILAEKKKSRLWHIKLTRWTETARAVGVLLQTFRAEAISLVSGVGTLVLGYYQVKRWVRTGHKEAPTAAGEHDHKDVKPLAEHRTESGARVVVGTGQGFGSGHGRLGGAHRTVTPTTRPRLVRASTPVPIPSIESGTPAVLIPDLSLPTMFTDLTTYTPLLTFVVFVIASWKAWLKKKKKQLENGGK